MNIQYAPPVTPPVLSIKHLSKQFGARRILTDISLDIPSGEIFGFLGPNGSGKTTTIKLMLGLLNIDSGEISICGHDVKNDFEAAMSCVGGIIENPEMYKYLSGKENLELYRRMYDNVPRERIDELIKLVRLEARADDKIAKYSLGMRQRLGVAQALLNRPRLLVLDEPTNDLDIVTLGILEEYLQAFRGCVIVVSHDRYFVDKVADHLLVFCGGGEIRDFAGTYSEYVAWKREYEAARRAEAAQARPKPQAAKTQAAEAVPRKLSFNEKRELEALETEIPALEAEKAALEASLSSGTLPVEELTAQSRRIAELIASIDEKTMRWLELSER